MRECEEMLKIVQRSRDSRLDLAGGSQHAGPQKGAYMPSMPEAEELRQLLHYKAKVLSWQGR